MLLVVRVWWTFAGYLRSAGRGVLLVTSQRVAWLSDAGASFALSYLNIVLHALSSDPRASAHVAISCM